MGKNTRNKKLVGKSYNLNELNSNKSLEVDFIIAPPQMAHYIEISSKIYDVYLKYISKEETMVERPNFMNVPAAIRELEKIEMIRQADGIYRLDHAVTANQKTILKAFDIDANYIKLYY